MRKQLRWLMGIISAIIASSLLLSPTIAHAFTPTFNEYSIPGGPAQPFGITSGPDGNLWFTERSKDFIGKITTSGVVTEYPVTTIGTDKFSITAGPDNNLWFTEGSANKIGKITTSGVVTEYSVPTASANPFRIIASSDGNLWFTEESASGIAKITTSGVITEYVTPTSNSGPDGITLGPDGNIWFAERNTNNIAKVTPAGVITEYHIGSSLDTNVVVAGPDGNIWFAESTAGKIGKMATDGTILAEFSLPHTSTFFEMAAGPEGNVWYTQPMATDVIGRVTPEGTITEFTPPTSNFQVAGITTGPDGNIWFTEQSESKIGSMTIAQAPAITNKTVTAITGKPDIINVVSGIGNNPGPATLSIVTAPIHGSATVNTTDGTITYTSNSGYIGSDSLTYRLCSADDIASCKQAVLSFSVVSDAVIAPPKTGFGAYTDNNRQKLALYGSLTTMCLMTSYFVRRYNRKNSVTI
ncbi:MAG: Ig-like domain-containing protein [Candidatus Saccharibacteria bacterium]